MFAVGIFTVRWCDLLASVIRQPPLRRGQRARALSSLQLLGMDLDQHTVTSTGRDYLMIADGYANAFPAGNEPLRILARLTEELGEVATEVARLEGHGTKRIKHGEPDLAQLGR